jgi:hypothetical protein
LKPTKRIVACPSAAVERLALGILDVLLGHGGFDCYWLNLPFSQSELAGRDFLEGGRVPTGAMPEIAEAVAAYVKECLCDDAGRRAA